MTAFSSRPQPLFEMATRRPPGGTDRRVSAQREWSLTEILSLTDAWKFVPESLGLIALILLAQTWLMDGRVGASGMPHPFWIPVLLMSGQYGIMGGLFAALAATAAFFIGELPAQSAMQDFYDYAGIVAVQPCAWFGTALVLGGLRTLHIHHHADLQERFEQTGLMAEEMADGLERAVGEVEHLEQRIATDYCTLAALLHSLAKLDVSDRRSLVGSIADVIRYGVGATSFAVYLAGPRGLEPCVGIEDGISVTPAAIAPLPIDAHRDRGRDAGVIQPTADNHDVTRMPLWATIPSTDVELAGVVVCTRLNPSQDPAVAYRRLNEICRVLAVLLSACPAPVSAAN
jgi:hypothetical protein